MKNVYYADYLKLGQLLGIQEPESAKAGKPAHDELLFIITHQTYELWFKQILFELDDVLNTFNQEHVREKDISIAVDRLDRINHIQTLMLQQVDVLETMKPLDFMDFRDELQPASGFQSFQFRLIEIKMGLKYFGQSSLVGTAYLSRLKPAHRKLLEEAEAQPSLFDLVEKWLERTPFVDMQGFNFWESYESAVSTMLDKDEDLIRNNPNLNADEQKAELNNLTAVREKFKHVFNEDAHAKAQENGEIRLSYKALQAALLIQLYQDQPILNAPHRLINLLMDIDEKFTTWRHRHALMALRMIGRKIGTGGSSGYDYLRKAAEKNTVFNDFSALSTFYIPRRALPKLPNEIEQKLSFNYAG